jgi:serine/threonine protein kinase
MFIDGIPYLPLNHRKAGDKHIAPPTTDKHICYCLNLRDNKLEAMLISRPNDVNSEDNPLNEEVRFLTQCRGMSKIIQCKGHTVQPTEKHTQSTEIQMQKTYVVQPLYFGNLKSVSIPPEKKLQTAQELTRALVKIHNAGILHRDLKSDNIFLDKDGTPHISDFGASCFLENDANRKRPNGGQPPYIAPEFAQAYASNWRRITPEALAEELRTKMNLPLDVYGMGCILYELFVGPLEEHPAFKASLEQGVQPALDHIAGMTEDWMEEPPESAKGQDTPLSIIASMVRVHPERRITAVEAAARFAALQ